eukprot:scaffold2477_cov158-Skeletonema_menzelii.AAC.2
MDGKEPPLNTVRGYFVSLGITFISDYPSRCILRGGDIFIVVDLTESRVSTGEENIFVPRRGQAFVSRGRGHAQPAHRRAYGGHGHNDCPD